MSLRGLVENIRSITTVGFLGSTRSRIGYERLGKSEGDEQSMPGWTHRMQFDGPVADFKAGSTSRSPWISRAIAWVKPYSLVNPPQERPVEIYFNEVPEGPLTPRLSHVSTPATGLAVGEAGRIFTLDTVRPPNLWLLITAPRSVFISILRSPEPWDLFRRVVLVRRPSGHRSDLRRDPRGGRRARRGERFTFVPGGRSPDGSDALSARITDLDRSGRLEAHVGAAIDRHTSHVMLCGNSAMIKDVGRSSSRSGHNTHKRHAPGQYTTEQYH